MPVWRQIGGHCADHQGVEHALSSVARCQGTCPSFYTGRGPARRPAGASPKRRKKPWCSSRRASWRKASAHLSFADSQAKKRGSVKGSTQVADASPTAEPENKPSGRQLAATKARRVRSPGLISPAFQELLFRLYVLEFVVERHSGEKLGRAEPRLLLECFTFSHLFGFIRAHIRQDSASTRWRFDDSACTPCWTVGSRSKNH